MEVRRASAGDVDALARLNDEVHRLHVSAEPTIYRATEPGAVAAWFRELLSSADGAVFIAESHGAPIGYVVARVVRRPVTSFTHARATRSSLRI